MMVDDSTSCVMASSSDAIEDNPSVLSTRLRRIVITNFKNYIGEHTFNVDGEAFVCIFGRNGAGKSCVVDAIAFCLGAIPQQLRVKKLANLVNDRVVASDSEASASVEMCFDIGERKTFYVKRTVDFAASQSQYVYKDSESRSWNKISKGDLESTLRRFGIDMQLQDRFIIRQANATGLAQMLSLQLLHFCEQIIGTSDMRDELVLINRQWKEKSTAIEQTRQGIAVKENEAEQCQPMVAKFQEWVEKKKNIEEAQRVAKKALVGIDQNLLKLYFVRSEEVNKELDVQKREETKLSCTMKEIEQSRTCLIDNIEAKQKAISEDIQQLRQITRKKAKFRSELEAMKAEQRTNEIRIHHFTAEQEEVDASLKSLEAQNIAELALLAEKEQLLSEVEEVIAMKQSDRASTEDLDNEVQELVREIDCMESTRREEMSKQGAIRRMITEAEKKIVHIEDELEKCQIVKVGHEEEIAGREEALRLDGQAIATLITNQDSVRSKAEKLAAELRSQTEQKAKMSARSRGDRKILQLQNSLGSDAVLGRLWQLVSTESNFAMAVTSALQAQLQYVVVRDRLTAVTISRAFADESIGTVSCCVLEDLEAESKNDPILDGINQNGPAYDMIPLCQVISCDNDSIRRVINRFGRQWMVCKDVDHATQLNRSGNANIVTLQGDSFFSDGSIRTYRHKTPSGGDDSPRIRLSDDSSMQNTDTDIDLSISGLSDRLKNYHAELDQMEHEIDQVNKRIRSHHLAIDESKSKLVEAHAVIKSHTKKLEQTRHHLYRLNAVPSEPWISESQEWKIKLAQLRKRKARLIKRTDNKEQVELLTKRAQTLRDIEAITVRSESVKTETIKLHGRRKAIDHQLECLQTQRNLREAESVLHQQLTTVEADMTAAAKRVDCEKATLDSIRHNLEEVDIEIQSLADQVKGVQSRIKRLINTRSELEEKIALLGAEIGDMSNTLPEQDEPMEDYPQDQLEDQRMSIRQNISQLDEDERVMEIVKSSISVETVERAIACEQEISTLRSELDTNVAELNVLSTQQHETAVLRHEKVVEALRVVNEHFSRIYRLMNEDGDCYLDYSLERTTLFTEGIVLNCKPDESHWQPFVGLSGGQQVVCAVSLMLALQASFPSPFYVCDEIDAALDTVNVQKLAELLKHQSCQTTTQFLVVSHRPEMWETAKYLIGVYEREKSAQIVSCRFS